MCSLFSLTPIKLSLPFCPPITNSTLSQWFMGNTCTYIHTTHTHMHKHNVTEAPKPLPAGCIHHTYGTYRKLEGSKAWVKVGVLWLPAYPCTMVLEETGFSTTADPAREAPAVAPLLSRSTCSSFACQIRWISIHFHY